MFDKLAQRQRALNQAQALMKQGFQAPVLPVPVKKVEGPKDMEGTEFKVGMEIVRPASIGNSNGLKVSIVTHIAGPCVYVDNSRRPLGRPERCLVLKA